MQAVHNEGAANCVSSNPTTAGSQEECRLLSGNDSKHCTASPSVGQWSSPPTTGPRPPPCSFFSFTAINNHMAVMFGGYQPGHRRRNDVYIIDFWSMVR